MSPRKEEARHYHHGDLHAALLRAAVEELAERGVENFTLRSCARRAGVSHAAPAHHFGDVRGLLTEVAIDAFGQLDGSIRHAAEKTEQGSMDRLIAVALGYVHFAIDSSPQFNLMFRTERLDASRPDFRAAANAAFEQVATAVSAYYGSDYPSTDPQLTRRIIGLWSLAQGLSNLVLAGQIGPLEDGAKAVHTLLPDMVRELFGHEARNDPRDLSYIREASALENFDPK